MELYIIRHGQSTNNALPDEQQTDRSYDAPLTEIGKQQAACVAEFLSDGANRDPWINPRTGYSRQDGGRGFELTHLYCSPMYRAMQTTQPIARATGLQPEIWIDVHEHGGVYLEEAGVITGYPGKTRAEIEREFSGYVVPDAVSDRGWYNASTGQESLEACYGRAIKIAVELRRRASEDHDNRERIAIVTHGTFIDALLKALLNQLPNRTLYYLHYNTAITRVDFTDNDRLLVRYLNRVDHLSPELIT